MSPPRVTRWAVSLGLFALACHAAPGPLAPHPAPAPRVSGPLTLRVSYPRAVAHQQADSGLMIIADSTVVLRSTDSVFLLGSTGRGDATLTVNGVAVPVYRTGGWIAWVALPPGPVQVSV